MSFVPVKSDTGAVIPWEYYPAAKGTYKCGQMVEMSGGKITALSGVSTTTPPYLCMAETTVVDGGEPLAVLRVSAGDIFETTLAAAGGQLGNKLGVSADGLQADGSGSFELVAMDGAAQGGTVRGRFV